MEKQLDWNGDILTWVGFCVFAGESSASLRSVCGGGNPMLSAEGAEGGLSRDDKMVTAIHGLAWRMALYVRVLGWFVLFASFELFLSWRFVVDRWSCFVRRFWQEGFWSCFLFSFSPLALELIRIKTLEKRLQGTSK